MKNNFYIDNLPKQTIFKTPPGYFENFAEKLQARLTEKPVFSDEFPLAAYSVLDEMSRKSIFLTPENYFETLADQILQKVQQSSVSDSLLEFLALERMTLEDIEKPEIFQVPENYFENLSQRILDKIQSDIKPEPLNFEDLEAAELGVLASIPKQNIFKAPDNYFERLSGNINPEKTERSDVNQPVRTVRLIPSWLRYSASVAALLVLGWFGYTNFAEQDKIAETPCENLLCQISDEEIVQYLNDNGIHQELTSEIPATVVSEEESLNKTLKEEQVIDEELLEQLDSENITELN
ncbi:MAG: hypothetical protein H7Y04_12250 [Verrucomicrobia bacterium]|nr:hypothetical protein [Cytophagales bacterium]